MEGRCLCGNVSFKLALENVRIFRCFCVFCQKQSGTESNLATIVPEEKFEFLSGTDWVTTWVKESGFTSHFCRQCGSPVPNRLRNKAYFWVPVGLLNIDVSGVVVSHIFTGSKRNVSCSHNLVEFDEFPAGGMDRHIDNLCV